MVRCTRRSDSLGRDSSAARISSSLTLTASSTSASSRSSVSSPKSSSSIVSSSPTSSSPSSAPLSSTGSGSSSPGLCGARFQGRSSMRSSRPSAPTRVGYRSVLPSLLSSLAPVTTARRPLSSGRDLRSRTTCTRSSRNIMLSRKRRILASRSAPTGCGAKRCAIASTVAGSRMPSASPRWQSSSMPDWAAEEEAAAMCARPSECYASRHTKNKPAF